MAVGRLEWYLEQELIQNNEKSVLSLGILMKGQLDKNHLLKLS